MAKTKIVLSGYYGFGNAGDEAILFAIMNSLKEKHFDTEIVVISGNPVDTCRRHNVKSIYLFNYLAIIKELLSCKILLSGGGSLLQDVTSARSFYYYVSIILLARFFGKKVMLYAQGIGPISGRWTRLIMKFIGNWVQMITVRDEGSRDELLKIGVNKPPIFVTADAVLGIKKVSVDKGRALLSKYNITVEDELLLISLREWEGWQRGKAVIADAIDRVIEKTGMKAVFVSMHYPIDVVAAKEVALFLSKEAVVLEEDYSIEEIISIFSCAKITLAVRLHALIFSAIVGTPFVGISYDPKVDRFLADFDESVVCTFSDISSEKITKELFLVLENYENKQSNVYRASEGLYKKACVNNEMLAKLLL